MKFLIKTLRYLVFLKNSFFLSKIEKKFILFNERKWKIKNSCNDPKDIILVDLFNWKPWIYIWSYLTNIMSNRTNTSIRYFYFDLYQLKPKIIYKFLLLKLIKIFKSFNVSKGIDENDFIFTKKKFKIQLKILKI